MAQVGRSAVTLRAASLVSRPTRAWMEGLGRGVLAGLPGECPTMMVRPF